MGEAIILETPAELGHAKGQLPPQALAEMSVPYPPADVGANAQESMAQPGPMQEAFPQTDVLSTSTHTGGEIDELVQSTPPPETFPAAAGEMVAGAADESDTS